MAQDKQTSERQPEVSEETGEDDDVIVMGTSYADATRRKAFDSQNVTNTTFIGKNVRFSNSNNTRNKRPNPKPQSQYFPGQGSQNQAAYSYIPKQNFPYLNRRRPGQPGYNFNGPRPGQLDRHQNNYPQNTGRNTPQNPDLGSKAFFVPRQRTIQQKIACQTDIQIVNLSSRKLTQNETKLLERGLKFTQTPSKPNQIYRN